MEFKDFVSNSNSLLFAASKGYFEFAQILLENYPETIDVNMQDMAGRTALHFSVISESVNIFNLLIERGSSPTISDFSGNTFFHLAAENNVMSLKEMVFCIIKNGVTTEEEIIEMINQVNNNGKTPYMLASKEMKKLMKGIQSFCSFRMKKFIIQKILVRSGYSNGKALPKKKYLLDVLEDEFVVRADKNTRIRIQIQNLAFAIFSQRESRIEVTLRKMPIIEKEENDKEGNKIEEYMKCLSFFMYVDRGVLNRLTKVMRTKERMMEFKPFSFLYRPPGVVKKIRKNKFLETKFAKKEHILERKLRNFKLKKLGVKSNLENRVVSV